MRLHRFRVLISPEKRIYLNPHQAPLVNATLAAAYNLGANCKSGLPAGVVVEAPEQGRVVVDANEPFAFGWTMISVDHRDAHLHCSQMIAGLRQLGAKARHESKPLAGGFNVIEVRDVLADKPLGRDDEFEGVEIVHDVCACVFREREGQKGKEGEDRKNEREDRKLEAYATGYSLEIRLTSPLRIQRPASKREKASGHAYMDPHWFCGRRWLKSIERRLRDAGLDHVCPNRQMHEIARDFEDAPRLCDGSGLMWLDLPYQGESGNKSLGGVVGTFRIDGIHEAWLPAIFWGQFVGAGNNTRKGLGLYRVLTPTLGVELTGNLNIDSAYRSLTNSLARSGTLLEYALSPKSIRKIGSGFGLNSASIRSVLQKIFEGTYVPDPPRKVPCSGFKIDTQMKVPSPKDHAIQIAVLDAMSPAVDRYLETSCDPARRRLGLRSPAKSITKWCARAYHLPEHLDIRHFFDNVDHDLLKRRIDAYFPDPQLVGLLMTWVRSQQPNGNQFRDSQGVIPVGQKGLASGSPISPVLALLLPTYFENEIPKEDAAGKSPVFLGIRCEQKRDSPQFQVKSAFGWVDVELSSRRNARGFTTIPQFRSEPEARFIVPRHLEILSPQVARLSGEAGKLIAFDQAGQELKTLRCCHPCSLIVQGIPAFDATAIQVIVDHQIEVVFAPQK